MLEVGGVDRLAVALPCGCRLLLRALLSTAATDRFRQLRHVSSLPPDLAAPVRRLEQPAPGTPEPSRSARDRSCRWASVRARCGAPRACAGPGPARRPRV